MRRFAMVVGSCVGMLGCAGQPVTQLPAEAQRDDPAVRVYLQEGSAGAVGCLPEEIQITHLKEDLDANYIQTWMASCRGLHFICTETTRDGSYAVVFYCKQQLPQT